MKRIIGVFCLTILGLNSWAQSVLLWSRDHDGGAASPTIKVVNDTIVVEGPVNTQSGQRLSVMKYDIEGNIVSSKSYGGDSVSANYVVDHKFQGDDILYILQQDYLGSYKSKIVIQKYDLNGDLIRVAQMRDQADTSYTPVSMALINDTSLLVLGYREYDYPEPGDDFIQTATTPFAAMFTTDGELAWTRDFDPDNEIEHFSHAVIALNGEGLIFGASYCGDPCLVRLNPSNTMIYRSMVGIVDRPGAVAITSDGKLLVCTSWKYKITELSVAGVVSMGTDFGTNLPSNVTGDNINAILQDEGGNIYVTGVHFGEGYGSAPGYTNADILTLKYNNFGILQWQNRYTYGGNNADVGVCVELKNGALYVGGRSQRLGLSTDYDYVLLKIDAASGQTSGTYRYNGDADGNDEVNAISVMDDGRVAITGRSNLGPSYGWTTQLLSDVVLSMEDVESDGGSNIYPVPVASGQVLTVSGGTAGEYSLLTQTGQLIQTGKLRPGKERIQLPQLASGVYLIRLWNGDSSQTRKLIIR